MNINFVLLKHWSGRAIKYRLYFSVSQLNSKVVERRVYVFLFFLYPYDLGRCLTKWRQPEHISWVYQITLDQHRG